MVCYLKEVKLKSESKQTLDVEQFLVFQVSSITGLRLIKKDWNCF